jgi:hypothetical protein
MTSDTLHPMLRESEGKTFCFTFVDGTEMVAEVISATHVDLDDTIMLLRVGALPDECAWQIHFTDIHSISPSQET